MKVLSLAWDQMGDWGKGGSLGRSMVSVSHT